MPIQFILAEITWKSGCLASDLGVWCGGLHTFGGKGISLGELAGVSNLARDNDKKKTLFDFASKRLTDIPRPFVLRVKSLKRRIGPDGNWWRWNNGDKDQKSENPNAHEPWRNEFPWVRESRATTNCNQITSAKILHSFFVLGALFSKNISVCFWIYK